MEFSVINSREAVPAAEMCAIGVRTLKALEAANKIEWISLPPPEVLRFQAYLKAALSKELLGQLIQKHEPAVSVHNILACATQFLRLLPKTSSESVFVHNPGLVKEMFLHVLHALHKQLMEVEVDTVAIDTECEGYHSARIKFFSGDLIQHLTTRLKRERDVLFTDTTTETFWRKNFKQAIKVEWNAFIAATKPLLTAPYTELLNEILEYPQLTETLQKRMSTHNNHVSRVSLERIVSNSTAFQWPHTFADIVADVHKGLAVLDPALSVLFRVLQIKEKKKAMFALAQNKITLDLLTTMDWDTMDELLDEKCKLLYVDRSKIITTAMGYRDNALEVSPIVDKKTDETNQKLIQDHVLKLQHSQEEEKREFNRIKLRLGISSNSIAPVTIRPVVLASAPKSLNKLVCYMQRVNECCKTHPIAAWYCKRYVAEEARSYVEPDDVTASEFIMDLDKEVKAERMQLSITSGKEVVDSIMSIVLPIYYASVSSLRAQIVTQNVHNNLGLVCNHLEVLKKYLPADAPAPSIIEEAKRLHETCQQCLITFEEFPVEELRNLQDPKSGGTLGMSGGLSLDSKKRSTYKEAVNLPGSPPPPPPPAQDREPSTKDVNVDHDEPHEDGGEEEAEGEGEGEEEEEEAVEEDLGEHAEEEQEMEAGEVEEDETEEQEQEAEESVTADSPSKKQAALINGLAEFADDDDDAEEEDED
eukprot:TRINITY_DN67729_c0_g7_i1.p1 TRINITY_DN67729_c0_g7~~TRINITY_DN67729_c0_g7_i1.p1  ORF type:complete len:703 (+),score=111.03 TRINITY_DN67729_c0_g7_i1:84-2192(+)